MTSIATTTPPTTTNAIAYTVATVGDGIGDGAVADDTVTNPDDATVVNNGKKVSSSFPRTRESRTNNSAQPTEFNATAIGATVSDATIVANRKKVSSSFPQDAGIQTAGQRV